MTLTIRVDPFADKTAYVASPEEPGLAEEAVIGERGVAVRIVERPEEADMVILVGGEAGKGLRQRWAEPRAGGSGLRTRWWKRTRADNEARRPRWLRR